MPTSPSPTTDLGTEPRDDTLGSTWRALRQDLAGALSERVHLMSLELARARDLLPRIALLAIAAAVMALTGWLALWTAIVLMLSTTGLGLIWSLVVAVAVNVVVAALMARGAVALLPRLALPLTLQHLTLRPDAMPEGDAR